MDSASGVLCSPCQGQLYEDLTGNNKDGTQMLIKIFYCKEELIKLDCSIKVQLLGRHHLLWCKPSACSPWKGSGKQLPRAGGDDQSRSGNSESRHCFLASFLPQQEAIRRNKIVHLYLRCFHGLKQSVHKDRCTWRYMHLDLHLTCTCLFCFSVSAL